MSDMTSEPGQSAPVYQRIRDILIEARSRAWQAVNSAMVVAYWHVGREIVEEEQHGKARAEYGKQIIEEISRLLSAAFGKGFDRSNLWHMRSFHLAYPILDALRRELTWTHYRLLLRVEKPQARAFYEAEAVHARWSTRELERQTPLNLERRSDSLRSVPDHPLPRPGCVPAPVSPVPQNVRGGRALSLSGSPGDGLGKYSLTQPQLRASDLEQALINHLQQFLLELGKGFAFMARQQRITLDGDHFYIDLVFYNRLARCFVLLDLKVGKLTHQDLGQMQMYVNYYQREMTVEHENPPTGIVLFADKSEAVVRYTLPADNAQIFASRYKRYLPAEEELAAELLRTRRLLETHRSLGPTQEEPSSLQKT